MKEMTRDEFTAMVRAAIVDNIIAGPTCYCGCGHTEIEGRTDAVQEIVVNVFGPAETPPTS